jgi:hypothetical protein
LHFFGQTSPTGHSFRLGAEIPGHHHLMSMRLTYIFTDGDGAGGHSAATYCALPGYEGVCIDLSTHAVFAL